MPKKNPAPGSPAAPPAARALPRWADLPDLELYMDQVLSLMERYLGPAPDGAGKPLTASMVNNYVKVGLVPAPHGKRYGRAHLAHLVVVCALKAVLPLADIQALLSHELEHTSIDGFYDGFCDLFEEADRAALAAFREDAAGAARPAPALRAALRAQAQRGVALALCAAEQGEGVAR